MAIFGMFILLVFAVVLCGSFSESLWMSEGLYEEVVPAKLQKLIEQGEKRSKIQESLLTQFLALAFNTSHKLDNFIREFSEKDLMDSCELPQDKNVITTVIGSHLYTNPKYIRKGLYANFRCSDPGSFEFVGKPQNTKCLGTKDDRIINHQCKKLKSEADWQVAMLQLQSDQSVCYNGSNNKHIKDPLSPAMYFQCFHDKRATGHYKLFPRICPSKGSYFNENLKQCNSLLKDSMHSFENEFKPSIIVDSINSTWDSVGWLLVERGSNVTLDCVYPYVEGQTEVLWRKSDDRNGTINSQWVSSYRNQIVLSEIDYNDTGVYTCAGKYRIWMQMEYYSEIHSHDVRIAIRAKECPDVPLPDFEFHRDYYRKFPYMNHVKRSCQKTTHKKKMDVFTDGIKALKIYFE